MYIMEPMFGNSYLYLTKLVTPSVGISQWEIFSSNLKVIYAY